MPVQFPYLVVPAVPGAINVTELQGSEIVDIAIESPQSAQTTITDIANFVIGQGSASAVKVESFDASPEISAYFCDPTNGAILATLPNDPNFNQIWLFKDLTGAASTANPIGLNGNGLLIDGQATIPNFIQVAYGWGRVQFNGSGYSVIG